MTDVVVALELLAKLASKNCPATQGMMTELPAAVLGCATCDASKNCPATQGMMTRYRSQRRRLPLSFFEELPRNAGDDDFGGVKPGHGQVVIASKNCPATQGMMT